MSKPKIIADDKIPFLKGVLEPFVEIQYLSGAQISQAKIFDSDALIIRTRTKCNNKLLDNTSVKFIASATIGYDHIDKNYCDENKIAWTNAPGCNSSSVEQYVVAAILQLAKQFNFDLSEKVIGIIGVGHVGSKIARASKALGMQVLLNDPPRQRNENSDEFTDLDGLLQKSDIITLHVPLNRNGIDKTIDMVGDNLFKKIKRGAILINTARGEIIVEEALEEAIDEKKLRATVIDVWRDEPDINLNLLKKITIATPHIAGYSADGKAKGTEMSVQWLAKEFKLHISPMKINPPEPSYPEITIDCLNKDSQEIISETYSRAYNIISDSDLFIKRPDTFELLREEYPLRREAKAYTIQLVNNSSSKVKNSLLELGFRLK